jgi:hypothetical protein
MNFNTKSLILMVSSVVLLANALPAAAVEPLQLRIKDHTFIPAEINIPANTKVKLLITNEDSTPEEFESSSLHREKLIPAGAQRTVFIGPLDAGTYEFYGEFNPRTAKGRVVVK